MNQLLVSWYSPVEDALSGKRFPEDEDALRTNAWCAWGYFLGTHCACTEADKVSGLLLQLAAEVRHHHKETNVCTLPRSSCSTRLS